MAGAFNNGIIHLDSTPVFVFYAGQLVSGSIQFELDQPLTFSGEYWLMMTDRNTGIRCNIPDLSFLLSIIL